MACDLCFHGDERVDRGDLAGARSGQCRAHHRCCWLGIPARGAGGIGTAVENVFWETALQQRVAREALSRVASIDMLLSFVSVPVGQLAAPMVAALLGVPFAIAIGAGLCVVTLLAPLASAEVRGLRRAPALA